MGWILLIARLLVVTYSSAAIDVPAIHWFVDADARSQTSETELACYSESSIALRCRAPAGDSPGVGR